MSDLERTTESTVEAASREALRQLNSILDSPPTEQNADVEVQYSGEVITLPREVALVLREILANTAAGKSVGVMPLHAELTTQQAADLLNVSRPHVVKLIDEGLLPGHKVGTHRRIYASDVYTYQHQRDIESRTAADELTALSEDMDLYD